MSVDFVLVFFYIHNRRGKKVLLIARHGKQSNAEALTSALRTGRDWGSHVYWYTADLKLSLPSRVLARKKLGSENPGLLVCACL